MFFFVNAPILQV